MLAYLVVNIAGRVGPFLFPRVFHVPGEIHEQRVLCPKPVRAHRHARGDERDYESGCRKAEPEPAPEGRFHDYAQRGAFAVPDAVSVCAFYAQQIFAGGKLGQGAGIRVAEFRPTGLPAF